VNGREIQEAFKYFFSRRARRAFKEFIAFIAFIEFIRFLNATNPSNSTNFINATNPTSLTRSTKPTKFFLDNPFALVLLSCARMEALSKASFRRRARGPTAVACPG
jgi:hypothetical protein